MTDRRRRDQKALLCAWLKAGGFSERQIAERLGCSHSSVSRLLRKRGIPAKQMRREIDAKKSK